MGNIFQSDDIVAKACGKKTEFLALVRELVDKIEKSFEKIKGEEENKKEIHIELGEDVQKRLIQILNLIPQENKKWLVRP